MLLPALMLMMTPQAAPAEPQTAPSSAKSCRELVYSSTRLAGPVKVCKTRAEWRRWDTCHSSVTRYCTPRRHLALLASHRHSDPLKGAEMVCKDIKTTGTRLVTRRTCLPRREWERMSIEANGTPTQEFSTFSKKPERGCRISGCI